MKTICIGNPGVGKSTLLNGIMEAFRFKAGVAFGEGMTTRLQLEQQGDTGIWYGDTPGLSDMNLRKQAAEEISKALKSGDDYYKIVFVVTEEAGRVRPADVTTMTCVLDAIAHGDDGKTPPYGIIINKMSKKMKEKLMSDQSSWSRFTTCLNNGKYSTNYIHCYEMNPNLVDEENKLHKVTPGLRSFLSSLPPIRIKPEDVQDVKVDEYEARVEEMEEEITLLLKDKERMKRQMDQTNSKLERQLQQVRCEAARDMKKKDQEMKKLKEEIENQRSELNKSKTARFCVGPIWHNDEAGDKVRKWLCENPHIERNGWKWTGHWNSKNLTSYAYFKRK